MKVLVLGATGFLGPAIVRALQARGREVTAAARRAPPEDGAAPTFRTVDRGDARAVATLVNTLQPDAFVDVVAYREADTLPLLEALTGCVGRYLLLSSADVYRNYGIFQGSETGTPDPLLDEHAPLRCTRYPYRGPKPRAPEASDAWMDEYDKIPLEQALRASALPWTIARLPMVYGPGDRQRRFRWPIAHMLSSQEPLVLPTAWARWVGSHGYVEDVADAIALLATDERAEGRVVNVGEPQPIAQLERARAFASALAWPGDVLANDDVPLPGPLAALDLSVPLVLSTHALHVELGFEPPTTADVALGRTIEAERALLG